MHAGRVHIQAHLPGERRPWTRAVVADDGSFVLTGLPPGRVDLWAWSKVVEGRGDERRVLCDLDVRSFGVATGSDDVELVLLDRQAAAAPR